MKVLFCTQSESLALFEALRADLHERKEVERCGFVVADSASYAKWLRANPDFEGCGHVLLKEWGVTRRPFERPNRAALAEMERDLGGAAGLFGAVVADRRLWMGKDCTYSQDYTRRFTDEELLCILQRGVTAVNRLFDELSPDLVLGFICVTMLDYVVYLVAKARNVPVLNLRPTRIGDRVTLASTLNDPSPEFVAEYARLMAGASSQWIGQAREHIARVRAGHGKYEGVIGLSNKPAVKVSAGRFVQFAQLFAAAKSYHTYLTSEAASDNHVVDPLRAIYFAAVRNPLRAWRTRRFLAPHYVDPASLSGLRYAFYPLHTEPEISLLLYGRPFVNQIEVIRSLAMSLPADMVLLIKEHPWMVGKRSLDAYRKLLAIPRVCFVDPRTPARVIVQHAALVAVITGSIALEAAMLGRPVITMGDCPFNVLPATMVQRCSDVRSLQMLVRQMMASHETNEQALTNYVAAAMSTSASVNLYSVLLQKRNVHADRAGEYREEVRRLADYLMNTLRQPTVVSNAVAGSAAW